MSGALTELEIVQNPALGAYALWRFGVGFQSDDGRPAALPLAFLVLPLLLHQPTLKMISSTHRASGLRSIRAPQRCARNLRAKRGRFWPIAPN